MFGADNASCASDAFASEFAGFNDMLFAICAPGMRTFDAGFRSERFFAGLAFTAAARDGAVFAFPFLVFAILSQLSCARSIAVITSLGFHNGAAVSK